MMEIGIIIIALSSDKHNLSIENSIKTVLEHIQEPFLLLIELDFTWMIQFTHPNLVCFQYISSQD